MTRYTPGKPKFILQTVLGDGGLKAANYTYKATCKAGSFLLMVIQSIVVNQVIKSKAIRSATPKRNYIGRFIDNTGLSVG